ILAAAMSLRVTRAVLWAAILAALALRFYLAWRPVPELIGRYIADDAFYYLTIARHAASGAGVTFDGLAPTNGFHPLYFALLLPVARAAGANVDLTVHLALTLLMVLNALAAWPIYAIVARGSGKTPALVAAVAWLLNPWGLIVAVQGVEAPVAALAAAIAIAGYLRARDDGRGWAYVGAALGVAM